MSAYDMAAYVLPILRAHALNADNVDWAAQEKALLVPEMKQLPAMEAYGKLRGVLAALADHHSFLQVPRQVSTTRTTAVASEPIQSKAVDGVGYVLVPGLRGMGAEASAAFSTQLCETIAALAPSATRGWIVDLRRDTGGNMWPMVNGLHALLGNGDIGGLRDRDGRIIRWRPRPTHACEGDFSHHPVAVLVGPRTASSGEAVAVAFRGRLATRFLGQKTAGLATSNQTYDLPDGGGLQLTVAQMVDRDGAAYPDGIRPEMPVAAEQDAITAAAAWLRATR
ncbi:S41 family peptidase [Stenotrophomonas sp. ESTM1D_MKCIP4_1]|uniref:S41 family peptidase n=1 Tax=Stenotrophomonas sp. ESTM1D_MKCIP4_1 TaxID=2072414 RepID=UPI0020B160AE|nr:S41 family peptidase [Stenotrophomonas sp. ESTM1D_MKCIP4_1]